MGDSPTETRAPKPTPAWVHTLDALTIAALIGGAFFLHDRYARLIAQLDTRRELRLVGTYLWQRRETRVYQMVKDE